MAKWAVFDVDGTILPDTSMEKLFLLHAIKNRIIPPGNIWSYFRKSLPATLKGNFIDAFKSNKFYMKNLPVSKIRQFGLKFAKEAIWPKISETGLNKIEQFRGNGFKILIMSGSPDFLTIPLVDKITHDYLITTKLAASHGKFSGEVSGLHPYGRRKTKILLDLQQRLQISFEESAVFANHHADADHMQIFGTAIAVNPTRKLAAFAHQRGWPIEWWQ